MENFEALPQEQNETLNEDTTPEEIVIPVKYNKQIMNLDIESAGNLAQKGLKFESIANDFEKLKQLAVKDGKSVSEFISSLEEKALNSKKEMLTEKCGGDSDLAEHILKLEEGNSQEVRGFSELQAKFPEIKEIDDLPQSVLENSKLKGSLLLDEFLRYKLEQEIAVKNSIKEQKKASLSSVGSHQSKKGNDNPEATEFLKGLWSK